MAGPTIDQAFKVQFNDELHLTYRQMGSKLRGLVRSDPQVTGSTLRFYKLGTVNATTKARNGEIPAQDPDHAYVTVTMGDRYVRTDVDQLDLTKLTVDVRGGYVQAAASAFGNETDDMILTALGLATTNTGGYSGNWTRNNALIAGRMLDANNVPRDGRRFAVVSPVGWAFLMSIDQFARSDYIGTDLPFKGMTDELKSWAGFHWIVSPRLSGAGTSQCKMYVFHQRAVGHGVSQEVQTDWQWKAERWSWTMAGAMSMGSTIIDNTGIVEFRLDDTASLP